MGYIYLTTNLVNGKKYIGQSKHDSKFHTNYLGSGNIFQKAVKKYGKSNFKKDILIEGNFTAKELDELEIEYIAKYQAKINPDFYNLAIGGSSPPKIEGPYKYFTVYQYDSTGTIINTYSNVQEAADILNITTQRIYASIYGNQEVLKLNSFFATSKENIKKRNVGRVQVDLYDNKGEYVKSFNKIQECANYLGVLKSGVRNALVNNGTCKGYYVVHSGKLPSIKTETYYFYDFTGKIIYTYHGTQANVCAHFNITNKQLYEGDRYNRIIKKLQLFVTKDESKILPFDVYKHSKTYYKVDVDGNVLQQFKGHFKDAAVVLGVSPMTLNKYKKSLELNPTLNCYFTTDVDNLLEVKFGIKNSNQ